MGMHSSGILFIAAFLIQNADFVVRLVFAGKALHSQETLRAMSFGHKKTSLTPSALRLPGRQCRVSSIFFIAEILR